MGKFVISAAANDKFKFNLKAKNGEVIATGQTYTTLDACKSGVISVLKNAPVAAVEDQCVEGYATEKSPKFEIYKDKAGEFRFRLKATNGQIIAVGEGYTTHSACKKGVASVKENAGNATIEQEV